MSKTDYVIDKPGVLFSFEMRKYASFADMNMMLMTITVQLSSFDY